MKLIEGRGELTSGGKYVHFYSLDGENRIAITDELPTYVLKTILVGYVPERHYKRFEKKSRPYGSIVVNDRGGHHGR